MRAIAVALAALALPFVSTNAPTSQDMQSTCKLIQTEIRNCACAVQFLKRHLGEGKGELLLKLWAAGEGRRGDHANAIRAIYREHGATSILEATSSFLDARVDFLVQCQPSEFLEEPTLFEMRSFHGSRRLSAVTLAQHTQPALMGRSGDDNAGGMVVVARERVGLYRSVFGGCI
jgi:hypothetical protein